MGDGGNVVPALSISILAALVSLGSLILAYASGRRAHMPVLQLRGSPRGGVG
ncbi:hypothetical protein P3L51_23910 [Streptomyces sp. PSRA5]|uniref:hypothetical protein n=1 Tax=Streptomyces panacea TaxID=3035064 RepID=UPI00339C7F07